MVAVLRKATLDRAWVYMNRPSPLLSYVPEYENQTYSLMNCQPQSPYIDTVTVYDHKDVTSSDYQESFGKGIYTTH